MHLKYLPYVIKSRFHPQPHFFVGKGWLQGLIWEMEAPSNRLLQRPITGLFLLQLLLLVRFSLFCGVVFFLGGVMGCGEQVTNWHYFIQSSFALHSLHFELSRISLSLESLLYHLLLRQSSIIVHVGRSTHLLSMISWCSFHSPEGFARRVPLSSIRYNKG